MYNVYRNQSRMTLYLTRYLVYRGHFCPYLISKDLRKLLQEWMMDGIWMKANIQRPQFPFNLIKFSYLIESYCSIVSNCIFYKGHQIKEVLKALRTLEKALPIFSWPLT